MEDLPDLGPWSPTERIYRNAEGTQIFRTTDPHWLVKWNPERDFQASEHAFLRRTLAEGCPPVRNMVVVPSERAIRMGTCWYAMRSYTGSVQSLLEPVRGQWRRIGLDVLDFLEDTHRIYGHVHMDIMSRNILVDRTTGHFVVGDYELVCRPSCQHGVTLEELDADSAWYYLGHGAQVGAPCRTWRMDLLMLGTLLMELTGFPIGRIWEECCVARNTRRSFDEDRAAILHLYWVQDILSAHPIVLAYLQTVQELVPWTQETPPEEGVYAALRDLLRVPTPPVSPPLPPVPPSGWTPTPCVSPTLF